MDRSTSLRWAIAGRSQKKLEVVRDVLVNKYGVADVPIIVASSGQADSLHVSGVEQARDRTSPGSACLFVPVTLPCPSLRTEARLLHAGRHLHGGAVCQVWDAACRGVCEHGHGICGHNGMAVVLDLCTGSRVDGTCACGMHECSASCPWEVAWVWRNDCLLCEEK